MRNRATLLAAVVTSLTLGFAPASARAESVIALSPHNIVQEGTTAKDFARADPATARYFFDQASAFTTNGSKPFAPTTPVTRYASLAAYLAAPSAPGTWVLYDIEDGNGTPAADSANPESAIGRFLATAHGRAEHAIVTPAFDLGNADTHCKKASHGGTNVKWFAQCDIAIDSVQDGGNLVVQTQSLTGTTEFDTAFRAARNSADGVAGHGFVDLEVSKNHGTAAEAVTDITNIGTGGYGGIYMQDTDADAGSASGWEAQVLGRLMADGR